MHFCPPPPSPESFLFPACTMWEAKQVPFFHFPLLAAAKVAKTVMGERGDGEEGGGGRGKGEFGEDKKKHSSKQT